jgi:hypothetical protein
LQVHETKEHDNGDLKTGENVREEGDRNSEQYSNTDIYGGGGSVVSRYLTELTEDRRRSVRVVPKSRYEITTTRCVTTQKSAVISYFAAEA